MTESKSQVPPPSNTVPSKASAHGAATHLETTEEEVDGLMVEVVKIPRDSYTSTQVQHVEGPGGPGSINPSIHPSRCGVSDDATQSFVGRCVAAVR